MATPPKTSRKPGGIPAVAKVAPAAKAPVKPKASAKLVPSPAPFVLEPEGLTAFVEKSDSALAPLGKRAAPKAKAAAAEPKAPAPKPAVVESVAEVTPLDVPPVEEIVEKEAPTPSQQAVVEPVIAATETPVSGQSYNALEGHHIMNEAIETSKKFAEDAKARVQTIMAGINDKAKSTMEKSSKTMEELGDITKGNLEAIVESSKIAAKGVESLGQSAAEYGRSSFEKTSSTLKSFASVKSPVEFFQLQSALLTATFDAIASETAKNSEAVLKLAGDIAQPISNRVALVSDKLKSLAA